MKADGTVVESWGDIDAAILPRSANKPIQAMAFVESGAVERFGLGDEHIALSCASHSGETHTSRRCALAGEDRVGRGQSRMRHPRTALQSSIEALARTNTLPTAAFNNCSGKHSGFPSTAVHYGEPTRGYIQYDHPVQRRLRETMSDLCGLDANPFPTTVVAGFRLWRRR